MPEIITRAEAKALGLKRYFTGEPCKHGHVCERLVHKWECLECYRKRQCERRARERGPQKRSEREKRRSPEHPDARRARVREYMREYKRRLRREHPEIIKRERERTRQRLILDPERLARARARCRDYQRQRRANLSEEERQAELERRRATYSAPGGGSPQRRSPQYLIKERLRDARRRLDQKFRERRFLYGREYRATYNFMRDILLGMGLITKEDTPAEQRGLVRAYVELGLINREEIEEWMNTKKLKKA
jgi:hypothetical protein